MINIVKIKLHVLLVLCLLACSNQAMAAEKLCEVLKEFEGTEPDRPGERPWFEIHWDFDHQAIWSVGCVYSKDVEAKKTCNKVKSNHTNQEFVYQLPQAIMTCYGYRFPKFVQYDWGGMTGRITLHGKDEVRLILDLQYRDLPKGESAIRVTREKSGELYDPLVLPPIAAMPVEADEPAKH